MLLTFNCPGCGKSYERPIATAGKKARCKQCGVEFVIPAPVEVGPPRSSEAIPVVPDPDIYHVEPPEPPARAAEPPRRLRVPDQAPPRAPATIQPRVAPDPPAGRPAWLIPSIVGGGVLLVVALNVGLFLALGPRARTEDRAAAEPPSAPVVAEPAPAADLAPEIAPPPIAPVAAPEVVASTTAPASIPAPSPALIPIDAPRDRPMSTAEIVSKFEPSVALIKGKNGSGTGFIARPNVVATNSHVIDGESIKDLEVRFPSAPEGKRGPFPARLLYQDKGRDLALLGVATDLPPTQVAESYKFLKGDDITVIGNPGVGGRMVLENAVNRGVVSSMTTINGHTFLQMGISINPGNSGGPVFDSTGRVIGVVTLKTARQEGLAFAVPSADLISALAAASSGSSPIVIEASDGPLLTAADGTPDLTYRWRVGQTYAYAFEMTIGEANDSLTIRGTSIYRVKSTDAEGTTLGHRSWIYVIKKGKDGGTVGPESGKEVELKLDAKGNLLAGSGSSPLPLLGDLSMLMIEPFPDGPVSAWDDSNTISLTKIEQVPGRPSSGSGLSLGRPGLDGLARGSARSRLDSRSRSRSRIPRPSPPQQQPQPQGKPQIKLVTTEANEETKYTLGATANGRAPIRKAYELTTAEMIGKQPRFKMTGEGTISFDVKLGVPLVMDYDVKVVEAKAGATSWVPIRVSARLLEGKKKEEALKPPSRAPGPLN